MAIWLNNSPVGGTTAPFDLTDRGLLLGDGVFDTALVLDGTPVYRGAHLQRLWDACRTIGIEIGRQLLAEAMDTAARELPFGSVRVTVTRGPGPRGLAPAETGEPTLIASAAPLQPGTAFRALRLWPSAIRRNPASPSSRMKTLGYLDTILAAREARGHGFDEALLFNTNGRPACAETGNLFLVSGGTLVTPGIEEGVMPGILRAAVLRTAPALGLAVRERPVDAAEVAGADAAFVTSSLKILAPVAAVGEELLPARAPQVLKDLALAVCEEMERDCGVDPRPCLQPEERL